MYLDDDNVREAVTGDRYGKFGKGFDIASAEDFELIFEHIRRLLAGMGQSLLAGDVSKNPLRVGSKVDGCRNCDLRDVCEHFGKYTEAEPKSAGDTLETLREEAYADGK